MAEENKKVKRPMALKRVIQNEKRALINKAFKSRVRTAVRKFQGALLAGEEAAVKEELSGVYSMVDKGVKRGIFKQNKANRIKKRFSLQVAKKS
jgi:small subunit ribosomal protein S20